jgi:hypothetical protein
MNKIFKYSTLLIMSMIMTISCRDEDAVRFPDFQTGVNARVAFGDPAKSFFNYADLANAALAFDIYTVNKDIEQIVYTVSYVDASDPNAGFADAEISVPGSEFTNGKASVELTSAEIAALFNLPGGYEYLDGGDNFVFNAKAILTDGRVIDANNSAPSITGGNNASFTTQFVVFVACPFSVEEAIGTYTITRDDAEVSIDPSDTQVEVIAGTAPNTVILKDLFGYPQQYDVVVVVNAGNGAATVAKQKAWDSDALIGQYGEASVEGAGFFFSCTGFLTVDLEHTVDAGSFGTYKLELTKN